MTNTREILQQLDILRAQQDMTRRAIERRERTLRSAAAAQEEGNPQLAEAFMTNALDAIGERETNGA